jgi:hypothetical protein
MPENEAERSGERRPEGPPGGGAEAGERPAAAPQGSQEEGREPRKRHGDALLDGSGTRHGVQERDERPRTGD